MGPARQIGGFGCKMEGGPLSSKALGGRKLLGSQALAFFMSPNETVAPIGGEIVQEKSIQIDRLNQ